MLREELEVITSLESRGVDPTAFVGVFREDARHTLHQGDTCDPSGVTVRLDVTALLPRLADACPTCLPRVIFEPNFHSTQVARIAGRMLEAEAELLGLEDVSPARLRASIFRLDEIIRNHHPRQRGDILAGFRERVLERAKYQRALLIKRLSSELFPEFYLPLAAEVVSFPLEMPRDPLMEPVRRLYQEAQKEAANVLSREKGWSLVHLPIRPLLAGEVPPEFTLLLEACHLVDEVYAFPSVVLLYIKKVWPHGHRSLGVQSVDMGPLLDREVARTAAVLLAPKSGSSTFKGLGDAYQAALAL